MFRSLFRMLAPAGPTSRLTILIFHRVHAERDPMFPGEVTADEFDAICTWARRWFQPMPLGEAASRLAAGTLPAAPLAITFDDGYADNHDVAMPILARHGLSATFFIASGFLDGGRMWNDTIIEAIRRTSRPELDLGGTVAAPVGRLACATIEQKRAAVSKLIRASKHLPTEQRSEWVDAIAQCAGADLPDDLMMSSDQVRALHQADMTIGAHTVTHPILARQDAVTTRREIDDGRRALQHIVGAPVDLFAYPNGQPDRDYGAEAVEIVRDLGFKAAVSTAWGMARQGDDMLQLPRFTPWDRTSARFGLRLAQRMWVGRRAAS
jgi:peptidoglycan/xylan/chitin deacetylase (PgdA/CDA1 family)